MSSYPEYKKVSIDYVTLYNTIKYAGFSMAAIARKIGVRPDLLRDSKYSGKMNPAILEAISEIVPLDIKRVCKGEDLKFERTNNGRGTKSGRMRVDWDAIENIAKKEGYSLSELGVAMGHSTGYLSGAKAVGGLSADMIKRLAEILGVDPEDLTEYVEPGVVNIIKLIDNQPY